MDIRESLNIHINEWVPLKILNTPIVLSFIYRRNVSYAEFSQFLHDFHDEYATVGFIAKDTDQKGKRIT